MQEPSDGELIGASLEDPERFELIFERHYDSVRRYTQRRVGDAAGEELAARTFLVAFERRATFRVTGSAKAWLLGIATNMIRHHVRDERTHLRILAAMPGERPGAEPGGDERLEAVGAWPALARELRALAVGDRDAFLLLALGDLTYTEIAEALGIPVGTVRSRIHRVRAILRERLRTLEAITDDDDERGGARRG